jgi:regulator of RNase E activity RraA
VAEQVLTDSLIQDYMQLSTPNVADALDRLGLAGAPQGIGPLWPSCRKIVGPAATLKLLPAGATAESAAIGSLEAVQAAAAGSVLVIDNGGRSGVNSFGGVVGFTTHHRGLAGCVAHGMVRDVDDYKALDLPVYARGITQLSIRNRCAFGGHSLEVDLGGVAVRPGDLVMGDDNGVVVVPREHAEAVLKVASECKATEEQIVEAIRSGVDPVEAHRRVHYDQMTSPLTRG